LDNVFQFTYSSAQSFQQTEGASSCASSDPSTIETGSWAFTDDGKTLLIDGTVNVTSTQAQSTSEPFIGFMILSGQLLTVKTLTSSSMVLSYSFVESTTSQTITIILTFSKS
jgi:hypothetical protein